MASNLLSLASTFVVLATFATSAAGQSSPVTLSGYLYDLLCLDSPSGVAIDGTLVKTQADLHTVGCLLLDPCIQSGYVLVNRAADGTFYPTYNLSAASTPAIVAFLKTLTRKANVLVSITATVNRNDGALNITSIADAYADNTTWTGYIYDNLCLHAANGIAIDGTNVLTGVPQHTVGCMLLDACIASNYVLEYMYPNDTYYPAFNISNSSTPQIVAFLKTLTRKANVYVTIAGTLTNSGAINISSITDAYVDNTQTFTGYIYDNLCLHSANGIAIDGTNVKTGVPNHTVGCMLLPACQASNFVLQMKNATDGTYYPAYKISNSSTATVVAFLKTLTRAANVYVMIMGYLDDDNAIFVLNITDAYTDPGLPRSCPASSLGYQCSTQFAGVYTYHWTVNATAPANVCTGDASKSNSVAAATGVLHMLVEAPTTGWVGMSFAQDASSMFPADAVLGWVDGSGAVTVGTWYIDSYTTIASGGLQAALNPSWAYAMGVSQSGGSTMLCFSRKWVEPASQIYTSLPLGGTQMNWAYADNGVTAFVQHVNKGGVVLNLGSGSSSTVATKNYIYQINVHGALMTVAWVFLLPLGALMPRHRWLMGEIKIFGVHLWLRLHVLLQLTGMILFVSGFVYGFKSFPNPIIGGDVGNAHKNLGITVMAMAGAQVCVGFVRPAPDNKTIRPYWNMLHHWLGRLTILAAWTNVYLGIYVYHVTPDYNGLYTQWLVAAVVVMGVLVVADVSLTLCALAYPPPKPPAHKDFTGAESFEETESVQAEPA